MAGLKPWGTGRFEVRLLLSFLGRIVLIDVVVSSNFHLFAAEVGSDLNFYAVEACFNFLISAGALFISRKTFASRAA